jgi:sterol desaturase/sphingolipid hydroxylase (fatty acid hydroxylase superfamily)
MRLVQLTVALFLAAALFALLERFFAALPHKSIFRRERLVDFGWWFFTPTVTHTLSSLVIGAAVLLLGGNSATGFTQQAKALQLVETLVAADLLGYFGHRAFHGRVLWRIHAVHHSAVDLDWLAAARVHPLNEILMRLWQVVPLYLLGFRGGALAAVAPLLTIWSIVIHANLRWDLGPLRYVIASPAFHRWHHTSEEQGIDRNFAGFFPWIDALFGTLYLPRGRQPVRFGVAPAFAPAPHQESLTAR